MEVYLARSSGGWKLESVAPAWLLLFMVEVEGQCHLDETREGGVTSGCLLAQGWRCTAFILFILFHIRTALTSSLLSFPCSH
jgi:hypothetical protein